MEKKICELLNDVEMDFGKYEAEELPPLEKKRLKKEGSKSANSGDLASVFRARLPRAANSGRLMMRSRLPS